MYEIADTKLNLNSKFSDEFRGFVISKEFRSWVKNRPEQQALNEIGLHNLTTFAYGVFAVRLGAARASEADQVRIEECQ